MPKAANLGFEGNFKVKFSATVPWLINPPQTQPVTRLHAPKFPTTGPLSDALSSGCVTASAVRVGGRVVEGWEEGSTIASAAPP